MEAGKRRKRVEAVTRRAAEWKVKREREAVEVTSAKISAEAMARESEVAAAAVVRQSMAVRAAAADQVGRCRLTL